MRRSASWEASSRTASQEILSFYGTGEFHYRVHKGTPLDFVLTLRFNTTHSYA
jgi:hypothetical protein